MKSFSFEKLEVWIASKEFAVYIYKITIVFPEEEKYGLVSQLRRAAISISSNIAEGSSRTSSKDQARFYQIAYGSLIEVMSQLLISIELEFLEKENEDIIREKVSKISNKLNALRNSALKR